MATRTFGTSAGNWSDSTKWLEAAVPTAADDVQFLLASAACTVTANASCRSIDCAGTTSYTSVLTINASVTVSIGDGTAGAGNRALRFSSGMTLTLGSATTSAISFVSTSATVQSITWATKTPGNLTFNGAGGSWQFADALSAAGTGITATLTNGTWDINSQTCSIPNVSISSNSNTRVLTLGSASITIGTAWTVAGTITNFSVTSNTATVTMTVATATFTGGGVNYNGMTLVLSGSGTATVTGTNTFGGFTRTGTAIKTDALTLTANQTVTGTLTLSANASSLVNAILVQSNTVGTARTITCNGSIVINGRVDFMDITAAGTASWNLSGSTTSDCQGNSGITFTAATTRYGVVAGNFSATATWSTSSGGAGGASVPLPQDTVILDASSAAGTYTADMPRLCKDLTCTGFTRTLSFGSVANAIFGSITFGSGMTVSGTQTTTLAGRGSQTITCAGKTFTQTISQVGPSGTYTCQDAFASSTLGLSNGSFVANGFAVTIGTYSASGSAVRSLDMGSGTWTLTSTAGVTVWSLATTTGLTFSGASATIVISAASTSTRTFAGGGLNYGTLTYTVAGSTGQLTVTGANTFNTINFSDASNARTLVLPSSTTTTVTTFNVNGTAGNGNMTIQSSTAGTATTLSKSSGSVTADRVTLKDTTVTGGAQWFTTNWTDSGNNTGWIATGTDVGTGTDLFASIPLVSDSEVGAGSEGFLTSITGAESGAGVDASGLSLTDGDVGAEAEAFLALVAAVEAGSGADAGVLALLATEAASGAEAALLALLGLDAGTGVDGGGVALLGAEAGVGAEGAGLAVLVGETGVGLEAELAALLLAEYGIAAETASYSEPIVPITGSIGVRRIVMAEYRVVWSGA